MINDCIFLFLTQHLISVIHGLYDAGTGGDALSSEKRGSVEFSQHLDFSVCPVDASSEPFKTPPRLSRAIIRGYTACNCSGVGDGTDGWPKRNTYPDISLFAE